MLLLSGWASSITHCPRQACISGRDFGSSCCVVQEGVRSLSPVVKLLLPLLSTSAACASIPAVRVGEGSNNDSATPPTSPASAPSTQPELGTAAAAALSQRVKAVFTGGGSVIAASAVAVAAALGDAGPGKLCLAVKLSGEGMPAASREATGGMGQELLVVNGQLLAASGKPRPVPDGHVLLRAARNAAASAVGEMGSFRLSGLLLLVLQVLCDLRLCWVVKRPAAAPSAAAALPSAGAAA